MAQSGYTPLSLYYSATATNTPSAGNLVAGELALNTADGKLFYKDSSGNVQVIASKAGNVNVSSFSGGTTGLTPNTATTGAVTLAGTLAVANGGTGQTTASAAFNALSPITSTGDLIIGNGSNSATRLAIGTNGYVLTSNGTTATWVAATSGASISADNTWTGTQTFNGTSSKLAAVLLDVAETVNVVAAAPSATTNFYVNSGSVQYYTSNAANNWTLNVAFSSGTSLNTAMSTGQSVTIAMLATQGSTAYYNSAVTIDGTSVTPFWQGGTAPAAGFASGIDVYTYTIIKTGSATYTVLATQTQF
jgi:hypothetical protein